MSFAEFEATFNDLLTNDTTALMGHIKLTAIERADLQRLWRQLSEGDRVRALELLRSKDVDVRDWA